MFIAAVPDGICIPGGYVKLRARRISTLVVAVLVTAIAALSLPLAVDAEAQAQTPRFALPVTGGLEGGPTGVPGGDFAQLTVVASLAPRTLQHPAPPPGVTFRVVGLKKYHHQYLHRYLRVSWRNLANGKSGVVQLRHWRLPGHGTTAPGFAGGLAPYANARTGSGPVVATVEVVRKAYDNPSSVISTVPGVIGIQVP